MLIQSRSVCAPTRSSPMVPKITTTVVSPRLTATRTAPISPRTPSTSTRIATVAPLKRVGWVRLSQCSATLLRRRHAASNSGATSTRRHKAVFFRAVDLRSHCNESRRRPLMFVQHAKWLFGSTALALGALYAPFSAASGYIGTGHHVANGAARFGCRRRWRQTIQVRRLGDARGLL